MHRLAYPAFLSISLLTACAHVKSPPSELPPMEAAQPAISNSKESAAAPMSDNRTTSAEAPVTAGGAIPPATESAKAGPEPSKPKPPKASTNKGPVINPGAATSIAATKSKPQLDFQSLVQRLRDTSAIGVFTKLSIKNQVDDLLKAFRGYYAGHAPPSLDDLRQRYDGLLLKVVSLVQDGDSSLASTISASKSAIWDKLSDRTAFQSL